MLLRRIYILFLKKSSDREAGAGVARDRDNILIYRENIFLTMTGIQPNVEDVHSELIG